MPTIYLRSTDGDDASDGSTWALAKATLAAALTAATAGGLVYVSQVHAETSAAANLDIASPGTAASSVTVLCVNDAAEPPTTLATTATVSTSTTYDIYISGFAYFYGITFNGGSGTSAGDIHIGLTAVPTVLPTAIILDSCNLRLIGSSVIARIYLGYSGSNLNDDVWIELRNTNVQFAATAQGLVSRYGRLFWNGGTITGATLPTTLILPASATNCTFIIDGCDLSPLGASNLVAGNVAAAYTVKFMNCKLAANVVPLTGTIVGQGGVNVLIDNCDSADTNYRFGYYKYEGSIVQATNCYLNATYSIKMTPITGASIFSPLTSPPITQWNSTTGSPMTATIEIIHNEAVALNDNEVWVELGYLGTSGFPLASFTNDKMAWFGTPATQTTSTAAWTEDLAAEIKQKLVVTFTPQEAGYLVARVCVGKVTASAVYVDSYMTIAAV